MTLSHSSAQVFLALSRHSGHGHKRVGATALPPPFMKYDNYQMLGHTGTTKYSHKKVMYVSTSVMRGGLELVEQFHNPPFVV